jgi:CRISPR-associated protein Cmr2
MSVLLAMSVGPVGRFITAGRRSRDLWWGSRWLSDCVLHLAEALEETGKVEVLMPSASRRKQVVEDRARHRGSVANKLVLRVESEQQAADVSGVAWTKAHAWLAKQVEDSLRDRTALVDAKRLHQQLQALRDGDFVELRAGWARLDGSFSEALGLASARRDATPRYFRAPSSVEGVPKCHLDPGRDSVLNSVDDASASLELKRERVRAFLTEGEQLDALYLARRLAILQEKDAEQGGGQASTGGRPKAAHLLGQLAFPPVGRVAAEPWLERAVNQHPDELKALSRSLRRLFNLEGADVEALAWAVSSPIAKDGLATAIDLPFDAEFLADGGIEAVEAEWGRLVEPKSEPLSAAHEVIRQARALQKVMGDTFIPYYAMVEMDGDGVGNALKAIATEENWRGALLALDNFADQAANLVWQNSGVPFYVAGDEVLFYAPVDVALKTVQLLSEAWSNAVKDTKGTMSKTSLSAGVALVHMLDGLDEARAAAGEALQSAKKLRRDRKLEGSALRVVESPRAGSPRGATGQTGTLVDALRVWTRAFDDTERSGLSLRTVSILEEHLRRFEPDSKEPLPEMLVALMREAVVGQHRASSKGGAGEPSEARELLRARLSRQGLTMSDIQFLCDELRIAVRLSRVARQRQGGGHV